MPQAPNMHAGLVEMHHRRSTQGLADRLVRRRQRCPRPINPVLHGARADRQVEQITQQLRRSIHGQLLVLRQVHHRGARARAILHRLRDSGRK